MTEPTSTGQDKSFELAEDRNRDDYNSSGDTVPTPGKGARTEDEHWMERALALARDAVGLASPNPTVGCVLVREGSLVGQGAHHYDARDHAEIVALKQAGERARGATAYVTLEPCSHTGRTGPCAEALLRAGVTRVVGSTADPNPEVSGRGFERLRQHGVEIVTDIGTEAARRLNDPFAHHIRTGLPFVTLKAGVSLDGRIASPRAPGQPPGTVYLTSPASLAAVQRMRHAADAVLTGVGTALADDPLLTDRSGLPRRRPLFRVLLDPQLRLPPTARLLTEQPETVLIFTARADTPRAEFLRGRGALVEASPMTPQGRIDLAYVLRTLGARGVLHLLVEAGSQLNRALLDGDHIDKLSLFYAPVVLGEHGVPLFAGEQAARLSALRRTVQVSGTDLHAELLLRDPWTPVEDTTGRSSA